LKQGLITLKAGGQDNDTPETPGKRRVTFSNLKRGEPRLNIFFQTNAKLFRKPMHKAQERQKQQVTSNQDLHEQGE
jgi:hypothetical protein